MYKKGISFDDALKTRKANFSKGLFAYYKKHVMIHQGRKQWLFGKMSFYIYIVDFMWTCLRCYPLSQKTFLTVIPSNLKQKIGIEK
jgi:hypothetical protein